MAVDLEETLQLVRGDREQLGQVLLNLVVNANDAMGGSGLLNIRTLMVKVTGNVGPAEPPLSPGDYALLSVSDTGAGFGRDLRDVIFEPFFTTKAAGRGTGLGLAIVYDIVGRAGGHVEVDSARGLGATFWVYLPVAAQPRVGTAAGRLGGAESVLLLLDDGEARRVAEQTLQALGYQVQVAAHDADALELSARIAFDLLVTCVGAQRGERRAVGELQRRRPSLRVLYISGVEQDGVLEPAPPQRRAGYLARPFAQHELAVKVRDVLEP